MGAGPIIPVERGSVTRLETGLRSVFKGQIRDPAQIPLL